MQILRKLFNIPKGFFKESPSLRSEIENIKSYIIDPNRPLSIKTGEKFYLPNRLEDFIQSQIATSRDFYEKKRILKFGQYIKERSCIIDVGANIGNHSIYWAIHKKAKRIYAFEPIKENFSLLEKNIKLNNLSGIVSCFNCGLGRSKGKAETDYFNPCNRGATSLIESDKGDIDLASLDIILKDIKPDCVNFIKIDVEGFEENVLIGAQETIQKFFPVLWIETFANNRERVFRLLDQMGYTIERKSGKNNYLFLPRK
ncbi:MAG TPA: hypothetical protein DDX54_05165 [Rhodospirillaceae bacterium]|jgi:FkbM family methyltransferase|nr:FkbM family methyltransferase [Alphaproteobacteria bacterium]HBH26771.1 hypothetical protein [Rhodospirillaceae bacterium]